MMISKSETYTDLIIFQVLMGGGRRKFIPNDSFDQEDIEFMGSRADGRNLLDVSSLIVYIGLLYEADI